MAGKRKLVCFEEDLSLIKEEVSPTISQDTLNKTLVSIY